MGLSDDERIYLTHGRTEFDAIGADTIRADPEFLIKYWQHQYERVNDFETKRLAFTNIIVAASVVAMAILADQAREAGSTWSTAAFLAIVTANVMAIGYLRSTRGHISQALVRARFVLRELSPDLFDLNRKTTTNVPRVHSIDRYQTALHSLLATIGLVATVASLT